MPSTDAMTPTSDSSFWDLIIVLLKHKKMILCTTSIFLLLAIVFILVVKPTYQSVARIYPPQSTNSLSAAFGGLITTVPGLSSPLAPSQPPPDYYVALMKIPPILDRIIVQFDLLAYYKERNLFENWLPLTREDVQKKILKVFDAEVDTKSNIITLSYEDKILQRSVDITNAFVTELRNFVKLIAEQDAKQRQIFYEHELALAHNSLISAEASLQAFQEKTGAILIDAQARGILEGIATIRAQIAAKEVELSVRRVYATQNNPDTIKIEREIEGLREQLKALESQNRSPDPAASLSTVAIPALGTEYSRQLREVKYYEALREVLLKQYEMARLDEANTVSLIQVLEHASIPETPIKPQKLLIFLLAFIIGMTTSVVAAFIKEGLQRAQKDPLVSQKLLLIRHNFRFSRLPADSRD
jgi:capsule polysaccharide export protein KpsE/RkpR